MHAGVVLTVVLSAVWRSHPEIRLQHEHYDRNNIGRPDPHGNEAERLLHFTIHVRSMSVVA
jgi:hypothetical protein